jgi:rare lipoprotein A (peptidoglycan hydrolase)
MMYSTRSILMIPLTAIIFVGCGRDEPAQTAATDPAVEIDQTMLDRLKEQFPVLREDTAPEPQPGDDRSPEDIPPRVRGVLDGRALQTVTGEATFYADKFEGRRTASGIPFRQHQLVAAHRAFPFGTLLRVTNTSNNRAVNVRVVDRGPFGAGARAQRTVIDLSRRAAEQLGYIQAGRTQVRVEVLEWGDGLPQVG